MIPALSAGVVHAVLPRNLNIRSRLNRTACGLELDPRRSWTTDRRDVARDAKASCRACIAALAFTSSRAA